MHHLSLITRVHQINPNGDSPEDTRLVLLQNVSVTKDEDRVRRSGLKATRETRIKAKGDLCDGIPDLNSTFLLGQLVRSEENRS